MSALVCEDSHVCFADVLESFHKSSHLCFGKHYRPTLQRLETAAVTSVLENAVNQLAVLGKTLPFDKKADGNEKFQEMSERFGKPPLSPRKYPEMAGMWPQATETMLKVQRDRLFTETTLNGVLRELLAKGSFATLRSAIEWQCAMRVDEEQLLANLTAQQKHVQTVTQQLREDECHMREQAIFWNKKHELLTSNLHDTHLIAGLTIKYANLWEHNRREQHGLILGRKEDHFREAIDCLQDPTGPNEERVHAEIMRYLVKDTEELKKELEHWTDLYDAEMMQRETDLIRIRSNCEQQIEHHHELRSEVWQRQVIIEKGQALRAEYQEKQRALSNVVTIQAWWRGVSFRAGLTKDIIGKKNSKKKIRKGKLKKKGKEEKGKLKGISDVSLSNNDW